MDPFRKYIITQIIKQSGKIPRADSILNQVRGLKRTLEKMGVDITKITNPKEITKYLNIQKSWFNQQLKQKAKNLGLMDPNKNIFMKKGPFEGFKPKVVPKPKDIKAKLEGMNKKTIERINRRRLKAAEKAERVKSAKDPYHLPDIIDPDDFLAEGGIAGMLGERTGYYKGEMAKSRPKKKFRMSPSWMMEPPGYRKVYESLEDIPEEALALMKKDPNFDLQTFLETVKWSEPEETRIKKILEHGKYSEDDIPWGKASPWGQYLNYLPFGEKESIGDGLLSLRSPSDADKVSTVMHEMRHSKMDEPWFAKSSAIPKWVQEYEGEHYLDKDIKDKHSQYRDTQQDVSGEELYNRFLDQHFYPDAAKKGELAGSDYEPYFDKILKDHWASNLKAYKDILKEEKRVKSKPHGLAGGGLAGMLGEPTYADGGRIPYGAGDWVKKKIKPYTKEGITEYKKEWLDKKDLGMTVK